jgi:hypothetical protein
MIVVQLRLSFFARVGVTCLAIAALAPLRPAPAQVLWPDAVRPPSAGPAKAAMVVAGRVKDAGGKLLGGARVVVVTSEAVRSARPTGVNVYNGLPLTNECHGPQVTDEHGKFELIVPRSQSGVYSAVRVYAAAPGHGTAISGLRPMSGRQDVELDLGPEHVVRGRMVDLKGQPAVGASVRLLESGWWLPPASLSIWAPTFTDDKGLFLIKGLGAGTVHLKIEGESFTPQHSQVEPVRADSDKKQIFSVSPAKRLEGRVVFADTGKPATDATIISVAAKVGDGRWLEARTDGDGNFAISPYAPDERFMASSELSYFLNVFPPSGARYTVAELTVPASSAPTKEVRVELRRGVLVKGKVTEARSGEPVAGARVQYNDSNGQHIAGYIEPSRLNTAITGADGRFELPVPPKPGHLMVLGPTPDYVPVETSDQELGRGKPGLRRLYADAVIPLDARLDGSEHTLDIRLRRGVTLQGRVLGPDDKSAGLCVLFSRSYRVSRYTLRDQPDLLWFADGRFELPGCDPDRNHTAYLLDLAHRLGATVELTGKNATEPAIVRLRPCGSARAQFVDTDGKVLAKYRPQFTYLLTQGVPERFYIGSNGQTDYALEADQGYLGELDWELFGQIDTDNDGRVTFPALVPGAPYRIHWPPKDLADPKPWPCLDFTVGAGEAKDLGRVVIDYVIR